MEKKFEVSYEPNWTKLVKPLITSIDAVDEEAARLYFKTYYPMARLVTIKEVQE